MAYLNSVDFPYPIYMLSCYIYEGDVRDVGNYSVIISVQQVCYFDANKQKARHKPPCENTSTATHHDVVFLG